MMSCCSESRTRTHSRTTNPSSSSTAELSPSSTALTSGFSLRLRSPFSAAASSRESGWVWYCWTLILRTVESLSIFTAAAAVRESGSSGGTNFSRHAQHCGDGRGQSHKPRPHEQRSRPFSINSAVQVHLHKLECRRKVHLFQ